MPAHRGRTDRLRGASLMTPRGFTVAGSVHVPFMRSRLYLGSSGSRLFRLCIAARSSFRSSSSRIVSFDVRSLALDISADSAK
jgi:hypothetical protein